MAVRKSDPLLTHAGRDALSPITCHESTPMTSPSRRELFAGAIGAAVLPGFLSTARADGRKPAVRTAHITDVHITKDRESPKGVAEMFAHMFGQQDWKPELVLSTGDQVMAVDGKVSGAKAAEQIALWRDAVKACPVPIHACLGNHDVWDGVEPTEAIPT